MPYATLGSVGNLGAKGHERELGHLKELDAKGYAYHGNAEQCSSGRKAERLPKADYDHPHNVGQQRRSSAPVYNGLSKRRKRERRHLEGLPSQGNANNGYVEKGSRKYPSQGREESSEQYPNNVANGPHNTPFPLIKYSSVTR